jgi:glutamate--cysteine ligase
MRLAAATVTPGDLAQPVSRLFSPTANTDSSATPGYVGLEIELIPVYADAWPPRPVPAAELTQLLSGDPELIEDGRLTFEPGGQVELSPPPAPTVSALLDRARSLLGRLHACCDARGVALIRSGTNPWHSCDELGLQTDRPRYRAMQAHLDSIGSSGRRMMRQTASLQICLDWAPGEVGRERWRLANLAGPALTAAFANSPVLEGSVTGYRSTRSAIWQETDSTRTGFDGTRTGDDLVAAYAAFALRAEATPLPREDGEELPFRLPFGDWMRRNGTRPDSDDLTHHLTTLFPPVRPHGYVEVRYLDALPERWMPVPVVLLAALLYDRQARGEALETLTLPSRSLGESWQSAPKLGLADRLLQCTAHDLFDIAVAAMPRLPRGYLPADAPALVEEYQRQFVAAGRCPADDQLDRFRAKPEDLAIWR